MIRFLSGVVLFFMALSSVALAQTPQQIEMLKKREGAMPVAQSVYYDEQNQHFVIPENPNKPTIEVEGGEVVPLPVAKPDSEIRATRRGPNQRYFAKMTDAEKKKYLKYLGEDRIFVSTSDFQILTSPTGIKMCRLKLNVMNNTPRTLKNLTVTYLWGETKTTASFTNIEPVGIFSQPIAMAGSVCERVTKEVKYSFPTCQMDGLTPEQCRLRIAKQ